MARAGYDEQEARAILPPARPRPAPWLEGVGVLEAGLLLPIAAPGRMPTARVPDFIGVSGDELLISHQRVCADRAAA